MGWRIGIVMSMWAAGAAAQELPKFEKLTEWEKGCEEQHARVLAELEKEGIGAPDALVAAGELVGAANRAWREKQWDEARTQFESAWRAYAGVLEAARAQHAELLALRQKSPPRLKLPFKPRKAIDEGLQWLAAHQDAAGCWDCDGFAKHDEEKDKCGGPGKPEYDIGVTGLALLAFLDAGYTDRDNHYALEVRRGLNWILLQQHHTGSFGRWEAQHFQYRHTIAALAVARAYALTKDERYKAPLRRAVEFTLSARKGGQGWRYEVGGGESDTSLTCWSYRVLAAARDAGIEFDIADAAAGARQWVDSVTSAEGRIGYNVKGGAPARPEGLEQTYAADRSGAMTAAGTVLRIRLSGDEPDRDLILRSLDLCLDCPPVWSRNTDVDMYYWYMGSLACSFDKKRAKKWKAQLHKAVLPKQHRKGAATGSWDPVGPWGPDGGRVYATAILVLALWHAE